MPAGHLINNMGGRLIANPASFNPRDLGVWDWIVEDEAPDEDTMSVENGVLSAAGFLFEHDALWDAVAYFVGYSEVGSSATKLVRHLPAVHPRWPFFRCTTVSVKGVEFDGRVNPRGIYLGTNYMKLPKYKRYRFDLTFEQPQMDYREDSDPNVSTEWDRMLTVNTDDDGETIVVDGGLYHYNAPSNATLNNKPVNINGPYLKVYSQRSIITVTSYGLPDEWIYSGYGLPPRLLDARGKVNSIELLGKAAGTMLLHRWKVIRRAQPIATNSLNALMFSNNLELTFGFTDPTRAEASETLRGWQLVPAINGAETTGGWYAIKNQANRPLYDTYDHNLLLTHWS